MDWTYRKYRSSRYGFEYRSDWSYRCHRLDG
jgi:hypothetical protein